MNYVKQIYSGVCKCGHTADYHHGSMTNLEYYNATGEFRIAGACLAYGHNETEGEDEFHNHHCTNYVDKMDPDLSRHASWYGTVRVPGKRPFSIWWRKLLIKFLYNIIDKLEGN